ncbi:RNA-directed DNA polymerase from mobile element jockey [Eumeta japonica]|uniref:RNA-directed DNA polymerase from mobile element jockey n=1 Tax=Eumeta variegata TaxID=151549 RepID=A0A4C1ZW69_EUMVA|nr:RNA-directed DNA polymerase from mobile element jockey [Eumeta japonica]
MASQLTGPDLNKIPDLLDVYITKNVGQHYLKIEKCEDLSSDHTPVILNLFKHVVPIESPDYIYNKNTNWNLFREIISGKVDLNVRLKTNDDIETSIEKFNSIIHTATFTSTPKPKKRIVKVKQKDYPRSIVEKIRERRKLKTWNSCLQSHLSHLTADKDTNYSLWRATKNFKRPKNHVPPLRRQEGAWARSDYDKATAFAEHLHEVFTPLTNNNLAKDDEIASYLQSLNLLCFPVKAVKLAEIAGEIKALPKKKAQSYDLLDSTLLSNLPKKGIMFLVILLNACLRLCHYPTQWKLAQVVMIFKPGKQIEEVSSYRPISLLPLNGKLFERVILNRLRPHLDTILSEHQFGFRQKHATIEHIHRLTDTIAIHWKPRIIAQRFSRHKSGF